MISTIDRIDKKLLFREKIVLLRIEIYEFYVLVLRWGVHNCQPEEAVGVVCKTAVNTCQEGYWKCDNSPTCIQTPFICDEVVDCPDQSDESPEHCNVSLIKDENRFADICTIYRF